MLKRVRRDIRDSRNCGHCCWQSGADCAESKSDQMCEICLSYPAWPSKWVFGISMQWLRLKGCHVACDEWTSGEICSLQHMWVTGSVMWAAASDESLKFGVQCATATNWFPRVNGARDNEIWLYRDSHYKSETVVKLSCVYNGNSYAGKMSSLYSNSPWLS